MQPDSVVGSWGMGGGDLWQTSHRRPVVGRVIGSSVREEPAPTTTQLQGQLINNPGRLAGYQHVKFCPLLSRRM